MLEGPVSYLNGDAAGYQTGLEINAGNLKNVLNTFKGI